jgi:hypothetical protein
MPSIWTFANPTRFMAVTAPLVRLFGWAAAVLPYATAAALRVSLR